MMTPIVIGLVWVVGGLVIVAVLGALGNEIEPDGLLYVLLLWPIGVFLLVVIGGPVLVLVLAHEGGRAIHRKITEPESKPTSIDPEL